jgi:nucleoside-diphosphate-sugar epimerase
MVAAFVAAIERDRADGPPIAVAGPRPITYRHMIGACAAALGRKVLIIPIPLRALAALLAIPRRLGLKLPFDVAELTRATENKSFDISDMVDRLGVRPQAFEDGLATALRRRRAGKLDASSGAD